MMISVTGDYLVNIIERHINATIRFRRNSPGIPVENDQPVIATNEEIADFILSIPYFDNGLKDFILGNSGDQAIIVSQPWEIAFILRSKKWAESEEWLQQAFESAPKFYTGQVKASNDALKLPY